jgi:hypothetical protein
VDNTLSGGCLCGAVKFEITGHFQHFYLCHCSHCRKDSGSAHAANLFSTTATLQWMSGQEATKQFTLPGTRHSKCFCQHCGSALPNRQMDGALLVVPAGCLDSDISIRPDAHLFTASKANWDHTLEEIPAFDGLPA